MLSTIELLNQSGYDFFFLVVDKFLDINLPQLKNFYSIYQPNLATKNSGFLLSQPQIQDFIKKTAAKSGHKIAIVPFKPSAKIDLICKQNNWLVIANSASLNRLLEDKIKFFEICQKENLPLTPSIVSQFSEKTFLQVQQQFGQKIVVQTHFGWAGNSSYLATNYSEIKSKIPQNTLVKFSQFLNGYSLINNCCLTGGGLIQSPVGLQYTGLPTLTNNPLATVGRQWPSFTPPQIQNKVQEITQKLAHLLNNLNYRGFFGLDFLVSDNKVYLLECNPRLTASFAFYTDIEIKNNLDPLFLFHLCEFTNQEAKINNRFNSNLVGSEITLKNSSGVTVKKYHDFTAFSPTYSPVTISSTIISQLK